MADQRPKLHSGEGHLVENLVVFAVLALIFLVGFYVLSFADFTTVWPFAACIGLVSLAYFVPNQIIGRSDSHRE
jgi:hypothetical protein